MGRLVVVGILARTALTAWLPTLVLEAATAQTTQAPFPRGEIVERVVASSDTTQSYALYLPSGYRPDAQWPLLLVMDPRGRALVPITPVRAAAERLGYIVVSSYNTMSDGSITPNEVAVDALLSDVPARLSIDTRRIYLTGFSGTARAAWDFGYRLQGHVAGIIGIGGGLPNQFWLNAIVHTEGTPFVFFGGAGTRDFNFEEMRTLDAHLDGFPIRHRFRYFEGAHSWPPADIFGYALEWMELESIRAGLTTRDDQWITTLFERHLDDARSLEHAGKLYEASSRYAAIAEDFAGLHDTAEPAGRGRRLSDSRAVRGVVERMARFAEREAEYSESLTALLSRLRTADDPTPCQEVVRALRIAELKLRIETSEDSVEVTASRRRLQLAFVRLSFYEPRFFFEQGDFERALLVLETAQEIAPHNPQVCHRLAQAHAQLGQTAQAVASLECFIAGAQVDAKMLLEDPYLEPLHDDAGFRSLLEQL